MGLFGKKWFSKKMNAYKGSKRDGPWELYYQDGALSWEGNFRAGPLHGPYETYNENGQLRFKGIYNMGKPCGDWIEDGRERDLPTLSSRPRRRRLALQYLLLPGHHF